jgi:hypothetical protein
VLLWGWLMELPHRPTPGPLIPNMAHTTSPTPAAAAADAGGNATTAASATASQSGCISLPRVLTWRPASTTTSSGTTTSTSTCSSSSHVRLHQAPLPELLQLLEEPKAAVTGLELPPGAARCELWALRLQLLSLRPSLCGYCVCAQVAELGQCMC